MKENKGKFTTKSLECLSYLEMCMKETMRLYPPGFLMSRVAGEDVKLRMHLMNLLLYPFFNLIHDKHIINRKN